MKRWSLVASLLAAVAGAVAQTPSTGPLVLADVVNLLANKDYAEISEIDDAVGKRGISFDLDAAALAKILTAANQGTRDPKEVAVLILTCFKVCVLCRADTLAPMSFAELRTLQAWKFPPDEISQELRVRGIKDLPVTAESAARLRSAGISEDVVAVLVPEDKLPVAQPDGYKKFDLKRADQYDASAPDGFLKVAVELHGNSQAELLFKHNALFAKAIRGAEPSDLGAFFSKPTPRPEDLDKIDFRFGLEDYDEKSGGILGMGKKKESPLEVTKVPADSEGRTAFRIQVTNRDMTHDQRFSIYIRWRVPEGKTAAANR